MLDYAESVTSIKSKVSTIIGFATSAQSMSDQALNSMRSFVTSDPVYDFGCAAWFLTTQCSSSVQNALQTGGWIGWENYLSTCVGVQASEGNRTAYYQGISQALS